MIKFVCASCEERLSVPDQHGGRKGICPSCGAINRIPLKGFAETQPNSPVIARPAGASAAPPPPQEVVQGVRPEIVEGALSIPALSGRTEEAAPPVEPETPLRVFSSAPPADEPRVVVQPPGPPTYYGSRRESNDEVRSADSAPVPSLGIFEGASAAEGKPADRSPIWSSPALQEFDAVPPAARPERRLPRPVKIALLIFAVLAVVGGLYCALYFGIQALMTKTSGG